MNQQPTSIAASIFQAATPVINIRSFGGTRWVRNVDKEDARYGPWLQADYEILNEEVWRQRGACLYLVGASDSNIRYVGMSRNRLKDRWRTSPAYEAEDPEQKLPQNQLFHSQCWKHIEVESDTNPGVWFQVRVISEERLGSVLEEIGPPIFSIAETSADGESVVGKVERWLCSHRSNELARWNTNSPGTTRVETKQRREEVERQRRAKDESSKDREVTKQREAERRRQIDEQTRRREVLRPQEIALKHMCDLDGREFEQFLA